jgi:hypothetical protein
MVVLLSAFVLVDYVVGVSLLWPWMLGGLGLLLVLGLLGTVGMRPRPRIALLVSFAAVFAAVRWVNWNSRKPFLRDLYSVHVGMTRSQVDAIMGKYLKRTGWPTNPFGPPSASGAMELPGAVVYRHTNEGWGNSDWGIVRFEANRVAAVDFHPD